MKVTMKDAMIGCWIDTSAFKISVHFQIKNLDFPAATN